MECYLLIFCIFKHYKAYRSGISSLCLLLCVSVFVWFWVFCPSCSSLCFSEAPETKHACVGHYNADGKYFLFVGDCTAFPRKERGRVPDGLAVGGCHPHGVGSRSPVALCRASGHVVLAPRWAGDGLQAGACPCRSPLPGGEQGIGVLPSRGRGRATRLLCLLPLRASGGHWPCSCGLFCLPL